MAWIEPKTTWVSTDYFNLQDWQRIVGNAKHLYQMVQEPFEWRDVDMSSTADIPYYTTINDLEWNLSQISEHSGLESVVFLPVVWYPRVSEEYVRNPSYADFNRWEQYEQNAFLWMNRLSVQLNRLKSGTFSSGNNIARQYLARR